MSEKTLAEKTKELENLVKSENEAETKTKTAVDLLKSALGALLGNKTEINKSGEGDEETVAGPETETEAVAEVAAVPSEEEAVAEAAAEQSVETAEVVTEKSVTEQDITDLKKVEDVEAGEISADEFLGKSMDFMTKVAKAVVSQGEEIKKLVKKIDAIASNDGIEKSLGALLSGNIELLKSMKTTEEVAPVSKMAGKERYLAKSADVETEEVKPELSDLDKDKLYKAYFLEKSIDGEAYKLAKSEGKLPEILLQKA